MDDIEYVSFFIPRFLWEGEEALSRDECIVLSAITSLDDDEKGCFASNAYLAKLCRCSDRTITNVLTSLKNKGYITVAKDKSAYRTIHSVLSRLPSPQTVRSKSAGDAELVRMRCEVKSANGADIYIRENNKKISSSPQTPQGAKKQRRSRELGQEISPEKIEELRQLYNEHRGNMPPCEVISPKMISEVSQSIALYGEEKVRAVITQAERNRFLQGTLEGATFVATFEWLMKPENARKVLNGNYAKWQEPPKTKEEQDWDNLWAEMECKKKPQGT